jgi:quinol monooxygenase YgiN
MEFERVHIAAFLNNFDLVKEQIRNYPGCLFLELWQDKADDSIFFTHSKWSSETDLENYRHSELFRGVWATTKPMFRSKAQAWSVDRIVRVPS